MRLKWLKAVLFVSCSSWLASGCAAPVDGDLTIFQMPPGPSPRSLRISAPMTVVIYSQAEPDTYGSKFVAKYQEDFSRIEVYVPDRDSTRRASPYTLTLDQAKHIDPLNQSIAGDPSAPKQVRLEFEDPVLYGRLAALQPEANKIDVKVVTKYWFVHDKSKYTLSTETRELILTVE